MLSQLRFRTTWALLAIMFLVAFASAWLVSNQYTATLLATGAIGASLVFVALVRFALAKPLYFICLLGYSLLLTQSFPITYSGDRPINISTDYILIAILLGAWLVAWLRTPARRRLPKSVVPYLLFSGWAIFGLMVSISQYGVMSHIPALLETAKWFFYTLALLPCLMFIRTSRDAKVVLVHLSIAVSLVVLIAYIQWLFLPSRAVGNIVSTFGSIAREDITSAKNALAVFLAMGLVVMTALFISRRVAVRSGFLALGFFSVLILWSFSRSALLGLMGGFIWLWLTNVRPSHYHRGWHISRRSLWLVAIVGIAISAAILYSAVEGFALYTPVAMVTGMFDNPETNFAAGGLNTRLRLLSDGLVAFANSPIWGYGFFARAITYPELGIVDNFYLDVALDSGIIGLLLMAWLLAATFQVVQRIRHVALVLGERTLDAWAWGVEAALIVLYIASISASFPYVGRILGTLVIILGCLMSWARALPTTALDSATTRAISVHSALDSPMVSQFLASRKGP